jgi:hypothetical protein
MTISSTVHVELHGLQRFLFASQRLKAMRGGQSLIEAWLRECDPSKICPGAVVKEAAGGHVEIEFPPNSDAHLQTWLGVIQVKLEQLLPGVSMSVMRDGGAPEAFRPQGLSTPKILLPCKEFPSLPANPFNKGLDSERYSDEYQQRRGSGTTDDGKTALETVSARGYVALVKLDGNGFGNQANAVSDKLAFFSATRTGIRTVLDAVKTAGERVELMVGGDDLLLLMSPRCAFKFVLDFETAWTKLGNDVSKLTFAAGVAIASDHFPLHRLSEIADQLCASAKRQSRAYFVVDRAVCTQSWIQDLASQRVKGYMKRYTHVDCGQNTELLTERPLHVSTQTQTNAKWTLKNLCEKTASTKDDIPRSKRRQLARLLRTHTPLAELAWRTMKQDYPDACKALDCDEVFRQLDDSYHRVLTTPLLDWIEFAELETLGSARNMSTPMRQTE